MYGAVEQELRALCFLLLLAGGAGEFEGAHEGKGRLRCPIAKPRGAEQGEVVSRSGAGVVRLRYLKPSMPKLNQQEKHGNAITVT